MKKGVFPLFSLLISVCVFWFLISPPAATESENWFYSRLDLIPLFLRIILSIVPFLCWLLHFTELSTLQRLSRLLFPTHPIPPRRKVVLLFVSTLCFFLFRERYFTGDYLNYAYLRFQEMKFIEWEFFWGEALHNFILTIAYVFLAKPLGISVFQSAAMLNSLAAGFFLVAVYSLARDLHPTDPVRSMLFFFTVMGSGLALICFGHIESYPTLVAVAAWHVVFTIRFLREGKGLLKVLVTLVLAMSFHPTAGLLLGTWLLTEIGFAKKIKWSRVAFSAIFIFAWFALFYFSLVYFFDASSLTLGLNKFGEHGNIFLSPFKALSLERLAEILPMAFIYFPLLPLWLAFMIPFKLEKKVVSWYLFLGFICGIGAILAVSNKMPMWKDWDLYAFPAFLVIIFIAGYVTKKIREQALELWAILVSGGMTITYALMLQNLLIDPAQLNFLANYGITRF